MTTTQSLGLLISIVVVAHVCSAQQQNIGADLGVAPNYNAFLTGNMFVNSGSCEGRMAIGGTAAITSYSIGTNPFGNGTAFTCSGLNTCSSSLSQFSLVVNDSLIISNSQVRNGGIAYGPNSVLAIGPNAVDNGCPLTQQANLTDFTHHMSLFTSLSQQLNSLNATCGIEVNEGSLIMTFGGTTTQEVCYIQAADLQDVTSIVVPAVSQPMQNATVILNVNGNGTVGSSSNGLGMQDLESMNHRILWNMPNAMQVSFTSVAWQGSVLAPYATVQNPNGDLFGQLWAQSLNTTNTVGALALHMTVFQGNLSTPASGDNNNRGRTHSP